MRRVVVAVLAGTALLAAGPGPGQAGPAPLAAPAAPPATSVVASAGFQYLPPQVPIVQGGSLGYVQLKPLFAPHNVTADQTDPLTGQPLFQSATVEIGSAPIPVVGVEKLSPGSYTFHCTVHPFMAGTLVVTAPPASPVSAARVRGTAAPALADPAAEWP